MSEIKQIKIFFGKDDQILFDQAIEMSGTKGKSKYFREIINAHVISEYFNVTRKNLLDEIKYIDIDSPNDVIFTKFNHMTEGQILDTVNIWKKQVKALDVKYEFLLDLKNKRFPAVRKV